VAAGLWAFTTSPALGLAGTGWLIVRDGGNIGFEAAPYYSAAMLDQIAALGGITYLAASHVHGYGALFQLQRVFQPPIVAIHADDLQLTKALQVTLPYDDRFELAPGYALVPVGGHYAGQSALHDAASRRLFCGDMFKVDQDGFGRSEAVSSHKAFHKNIPLTHRELKRYRKALAPLNFTSLCTPFEFAPDVGRDIALAAIDQALSRPPGVVRYPLPGSLAAVR
jgi:glyoxylase-like metal-dependent hydrolase (beta-lactamase superfamily II)